MLLLRLFLLLCILFGVYSPTFAVFNFSNRNSTIKINTGGRFLVNSAATNWRGTLDERGTFNGSIFFNDGTLSIQRTPAFFDSSYSTTASQPLILSGNKLIRFDSGVVTKKILASGTGNRIEGQPVFADDLTSSPNITLQNSSAAATFALQSKLQSFVLLNGGTITLDDDLALGDGKTFLGSGRVNLNNRRIVYGGSDVSVTSSIFWNDATDIELYAKTSLSGTWTFGATGSLKEAHIIGNGNILDIGSGGQLWVKAGIKLYLTDIKLKGLGTGKGRIIFEDDSAQLRLSDASIELSDNYTVTQGGIYVEGQATVVTRNKTLTFSQAGTCTVDGVTLWYDTTSFAPTDNIQPLAGAASNFGSKNIALVNDGVIQAVASGDLLQDNSNALVKLYEFERTNSNMKTYWIKNVSNALAYATRTNSNALAYGVKNNSNAIINIINPPSVFINEGDTYLLTGDIYLHDSLPLRKIIALGSGTFDGQNNTVRFAGDDDLIDIAPGATLIIKNTVLKDFSPSHVNLNGTGNIVFGDGTVIHLSSNKQSEECGTLDLNYTWSFVGGAAASGGKVIIDGSGLQLNLQTRDALSVQATSTLIIQNITINNLSDFKIKCIDRLSTICWSNVDLILSNDYTFSNGYMDFLPDVSIRGVGRTFAYTSDRDGIVDSGTILMFDHGVTFSYDPVQLPSKTIFKLADIDSTLYLRGATLHSAGAGLKLTQGNLFIDDKVTFSSEAQTNAQALSIQEGVNVKLLAGANLNVFGRLEVES